jgi:C4-dicarboxylate-specific signal transduction histidine kinase
VALPLRRQIVILNAVILVPVFAVLAWSAGATYNEQVREIASETRAIAATVVVYLERGLDLAAVQTVIEAIPLPDGSVITITDDRSVILARSRDAPTYVGRATDTAPVPARAVAGTVIREGMDGVERVFGNAAFEPGPLLVSVGVPTSVAFDRVAPIFKRTVAIVVSVTLFVFALEFFMVRRYTRAFDFAVENSARVAAGDLAPRSTVDMPSLELERLQATFVAMVRKLREAREALSAQVAEERRIREELELLQRQVIRQERLAAIGVLVSGVAHELNNPLQAILGFAELLQLRKDLPPNIVSDLELIQRESARASAIIRNLSRFGRQQSSEPTLVRLRDVVASVVELRQRKIEEGHIHLEVEDRGQLPVMAVFTELQQVVLNMLINAEQALTYGMSPWRIIVRTMDVGNRARLEVQDSGPGVPREHEAKLFQPFFTTKSVGEGTGLGLSISYGIIQSHGGTIGYRPAPGGGALFYFELPVAQVVAAEQHP